MPPRRRVAPTSAAPASPLRRPRAAEPVTDDAAEWDPSQVEIPRPAFERPFGQVTAGNSSQITDGACWTILASEEMVKRHDLKPLARIVDCVWSGLDPSIMPAVIGPAPGGLSYWQAIGILEGIAAKARLAAFNIVEFLPDRDIGGLGGLTAARIVANVLGLLARQTARGKVKETGSA